MTGHTLPLCSPAIMARAAEGWTPNLPECLYPPHLRDAWYAPPLIAERNENEATTEPEAP